MANAASHRTDASVPVRGRSASAMQSLLKLTMVKPVQLRKSDAGDGAASPASQRTGKGGAIAASPASQKTRRQSLLGPMVEQAHLRASPTSQRTRQSLLGPMVLLW